MTEILAALLGVFVRCLVPVFLLISLGWVVQRRLGLDIKTLTRLNLWIFVPALVVDKLSTAQIDGTSLLHVAGFTFGLQVALYGVTRLWSWARGYSVSLAAAFTCSVVFYNSGNFGLPVVELAFGAGSPALALQTIVLAVQNTTTFSAGQVIIRGPELGVWGALREYFKMPFPYAIVLGLTLLLTGWSLPSWLAAPLRVLSGGLVPVALVTLGAQLALVQFQRGGGPVLAATGIRLVVSPLLAFAALKLLGWHGLLAQQLLVSSAVPSAINSALLAIEFDSEAEFASRTVMLTTLASAVTMALTIYVALRAF